MQNRIYFFITLISFFFITSFTSPNWGPTGHRTVSKIAEKYLKKKVKKKISKILDGQSLAYISTYADEIKSDIKYSKYSAWHYVNFPFGMKYEDSKKSPYGDLAVGIETCKSKIRDKNTSKADKAFYLKLLVHLIGDLHQPLHIGRKEDKGGNTIQVQWHKKGTNLHHIWDEDMINQWDMSYKELASNAKPLTKLQIKKIQEGTVIDWINETRQFTIKVYNSAKKGDNLSWKYSHDYFHPMVEPQLEKAGLRLAKVLNNLFK